MQEVNNDKILDTFKNACKQRDEDERVYRNSLEGKEKLTKEFVDSQVNNFEEFLNSEIGKTITKLDGEER